MFKPAGQGADRGRETSSEATAESDSPAAAPAGALTDAERWQRVKQRLRAELGDDIFSSWFARMDLDSRDGGCVRLSVPTRFLKSWILSHYAERVLACWRAEDPTVQRTDLVLRSALIRTVETKPRCAQPAAATVASAASAASAAPAMPAATPMPATAANDAYDRSPLDPRLTFDTFLVGRSNTLAHAAAKQVALAQPGDAVMFNPLYIHAGVGLGKTHLLQAIAWAGGAQRKIRYLTAERFIFSFVSALKNQTAIAFKEALHGLDVLVIDDLQFLQGKQTQAEFCHTLNTLIDSGRQVIVAADRPPADLESLDDRMRSRLAGGLVVEIGPLGEDLRLEILRSRVTSARLMHPSFDVPAAVLAYVAKAVTHNGRDLDGALNRLLAHNSLTGQPVTMEMAEAAVRDLVRPQEPKRIKIEDIQRMVARHFNVNRSDMLSSRRTANVVRPRQIAMYLAKTLTLRSLPEIGRRFGGRDHTTVLHAVRKIEALADKDQTLAEEIESIKRQLME